MRWIVNLALVATLAITAGCGVLGKRDEAKKATGNSGEFLDRERAIEEGLPVEGRTTLFDAFKRGKGEQSVQVNRYLWAASLEVLDFLPVQSVDPFTGVIVTGFGNPPGGNQAYRATVHIKDPALDARSLNVALQTRNGRAVSAGTARAVEDAILSRARQLRIADKKF
ncbi:DUF3576 domain-containing protein [Epibacterium sp. SM1969]|uniref:DUF3576 domain-containing protein n=1 Tax=Tritonibacter aquimaris TaxID=2663379 RepID=A0A844AKP1_9RHOB|nr:DUF3576 domain-containing protein [Tritonibacter aquimaris]MQY41789.1 DUF3576 domain-containing protein [Tritonibacter aquimaris]